MLRHRLLCITLAALAALSPAHGQEEKSSRSALEAFVAEQGKDAIEANHQMQALLLGFADYYAQSLGEAFTPLLEEELDPAVRANALAGKVLGEANETIAGLDRSLATVERLLGGEDVDPFSAARDLGVTLIAVFFACALAAALAYRYLAARIAPAVFAGAAAIAVPIGGAPRVSRGSRRRTSDQTSSTRTERIRD